MTSAFFDTIAWRDPLSGLPLEPVIDARTPSGCPIVGALRVAGTSKGYPIVDCIARLTPELAYRYAEWLRPYNLEPASFNQEERQFQNTGTVESFGWQWALAENMRTDDDLKMRVLDNFKLLISPK